jgi:RimJ/RimL family protein N-acetyltransferase
MINFDIAQEIDGEALRRVAINAFEEDRVLYGSMPPGIESLEWHLSKIKNGLYYKITLDNNIIGGINLYRLSQDHFRLGAIFIDPAFQNQGIGKKAVNFIETTHSHIKKWSLDTPYKSYRNHYFYEKHGYVKVEEFKPEENSDFCLFEYVKEIS